MIVSLAVVAGCAASEAASPLPSWLSDFPHEAPALEGRLPQRAGELELSVWSVRGAHVLDVRGDEEFITAVLAHVGTSVDHLSMAVAGRVVDTDPPNWVSAYQIDRATGQDILDAFEASDPGAISVGELLTFEGRTVVVLRDEESDQTLIEYAAPDAYFVVVSPDQPTALDMLRQIDR